MKKCLWITAFILLAGCTHRPEYFPPEATMVSYDFGKYQDKGFTFSPYEPDREFESRGYICITYYTEIEWRFPDQFEKERRKIKIDWYKYKIWIATPIDVEKLLEPVYKQAVSLGANALTSMTIEYTPKFFEWDDRQISQPGYTITGYAVKLK